MMAAEAICTIKCLRNGTLVVMLLILLMTTAHGAKGRLVDPPIGFSGHFAALNDSESFGIGWDLLFGQSGGEHETNIFSTFKFPNDDKSKNAVGLTKHLMAHNESEALLRLNVLVEYMLTYETFANLTVLDQIRDYAASNLLTRFMANFALVEPDAVESILGPNNRAYRSMLLGLNALVVLAHNAQNRSSKLVLNHFSCLDPHEQKSFKGLILNIERIANRTSLLRRRQLLFGRTHAPTFNLDLPGNVDWSPTGANGPVVNQGSCGACWAFVAVQVLQARLVVSKQGNLTSLSEQQLTSCIMADGCQGGDYEMAWNYVHANGIVSLIEYPYTNGASSTALSCDANATNRPLVTASTYNTGYAPIYTEDQMAAAVASGGPIGIAIAAPACFSQYSSGVLMAADCPCYNGPDSIDHAVTIVGYGKLEDGTQYWKVKNSWGSNWGQGGYMLMERNAATTMGMCGLLIDPNYPQTVSLSAACSQSNPPSYCIQALPAMYTSINTTTGESLDACVSSTSGEFTTDTCEGNVVPSDGIPTWAWTLIGIGSAVCLLLVLIFVIRICKWWKNTPEPADIKAQAVQNPSIHTDDFVYAERID